MNLKELRSKVDNGEKFQYIFFWGNKGEANSEACLSQWFPCRFEADGIRYSTAEQYMMAKKAELFGDDDIKEQIMKADSPEVYKKLGRKVKNFDRKIWDNHKEDIVYKGNIAKFSNNPDLKKFLLSTEDKILVEASPFDKIWGIGLSADDPRAASPNLWEGINLLGFTLMKVRDAFNIYD